MAFTKSQSRRKSNFTKKKTILLIHSLFESIRYSSLLEKTLLVMENLFFECQISHKFDLKGSDRNRLVDTTNLNGEIVLLDENLIQSSFKRKSFSK